MAEALDSMINLGRPSEPELKDNVLEYEKFEREWLTVHPDGYCIRLGNRLQIALSKLSKDQVKQRFKTFAMSVANALRCDGVIVFVQEPHETGIAQRAGVGDVLSFETANKIKGSPADLVYGTNREVVYTDLMNVAGMNASRKEALEAKQSLGCPFRCRSNSLKASSNAGVDPEVSSI